MDAEELFEMIHKLEQEPHRDDIKGKITKNPEVITLSNSYCEQCGDCCEGYALEGGDNSVRECSNREIRNELSCCLLHSDGAYPNGREIPQLNEAVANRLDPTKFAKPECCHITGPYLTLLSMIEAKREGDQGLLECVKCHGGLKMLEEYRAFVADK